MFTVLLECAAARDLVPLRITPPDPKMIHSLVSELAADGIPITVTRRMLNIARQPSYRSQDHPVTKAEGTRPT
jgi:hypothetical protein